MALWVRTHNLVMNRVKCINDVTNDLCRVFQRGARYMMTFCGDEVCTWSAYDQSSVASALDVAGAILDTCWNLRREGFATF